jgi:hypothetical protein
MNCPICSNINTKINFRNEDFIVLKCDSCFFYFVELESWKHPYNDIDYYSSGDIITDPSQLEFIKYRVDQILKYITMGDGLDLGCGKGEVTVQLANKGFNLYAGENSKVSGGFEHSGLFALIDKEGNIRCRKDKFGNPIMYYDGLEQSGIDALKEDIKLLLKE